MAIAMLQTVSFFQIWVMYKVKLICSFLPARLPQIFIFLPFEMYVRPSIFANILILFRSNIVQSK